MEEKKNMSAAFFTARFYVQTLYRAWKFGQMFSTSDVLKVNLIIYLDSDTFCL